MYINQDLRGGGYGGHEAYRWKEWKRDNAGRGEEQKRRRRELKRV